MPRVVEKLSDQGVRRVSRPGLHADGGGLYLAVTPRKRGLGVTKSWVLRFTAPGGRRREMGLGPWPDIQLTAARRLAAERRREASEQGIDPIEVRAVARLAAKVAATTVVTFAQAAEMFIASKEGAGDWRNDRSAGQWRASLRDYAYPVFGNVGVAEIDTARVIRVLEPIWAEKPETARRVRGRVAEILDWCTVRGYRDGLNPARFQGHLQHALPKVSRAAKKKPFAALAYDRIGPFLHELRTRTGAAADALEFVVMTAARTSEVLGATWAEVDLEHATWTIPARRMKAHKDHRVPLNAPALRVLRAIRADYATRKLPHLVFTRTADELSNMCMLALLKRMGLSITTHGMRSCFRDWAAERTNFPREVAEMSLAHVIGDKVEAAYRRGDLFDKRKRLMAAWGEYCDAQAAKHATTDAVVRGDDDDQELHGRGGSHEVHAAKDGGDHGGGRARNGRDGRSASD